SAAASSSTYTFDGSGLVLTKGTTKVLALKCNVAAGASGPYYWGLSSASSFSATGLTSGQSLTPTASASDGQKMTLASAGSYTVTDDSTPGYRIVNATQAGVVLTRLKFAALDEDVDVRQIRFQLTGTASNTPLDLYGQIVTLYDEATPTVALGTAQFGSGGTVGADMATTTLASGTFVIPKGSSKTLLVKGDINAITASGPLSASGDFLKVNYDGTLNGSSGGGNYGVGQSSGTEISPGSADTAVQGVRIMRGYPVFAKCTGSGSGCDAVPTNVLTVKSGMSLYRFKVTAVGNDVRIAKLTFQVSSTTGAGLTDTSSTATTTKYSVYAYTDSSFSQADTTFSSNGLLNATQCYVNGLDTEGRPVTNTTGLAAANSQIMIYPDAAGTACGSAATAHSTTTYKVPFGTTRYFDFQADVASVESVTGTQSFAVSLLGDAAFGSGQTDGDAGQGEMGRGVQGIASQNGKSTVDDDTSNNDFIWSPSSTSSSFSINNFDFTNGYQVPGIPTTNMPTETFTSPN
ncbi:MAG: hypothetical protein HY975_04355, partial [Candidatus Kerfeldbacteria bacterium]|nr:hypothetical protein [Candidatus Kerfeldbacteria bacterium]